MLAAMATQRLYYDKPEALDVDALVLSVSPVDFEETATRVVLDRTPFYPEGGGQPWDLGTIAGMPVSSVVEIEGEPVHFLAGSPASLEPSGLVPGARVRCRVDASRRRDHSEQHTAQHLLSATVLRILGAPTRSFHLGDRYSSIDVDIPAMDRTDVDAVEAAVLEVIQEDYPVTTHLCPPEDPDSFPLRRKPPADAEVLRILEIDGLDYTPCAGTHLRSTGAIHTLRILKAEKYKGMTRIYFLAGGRAQADYAKLAASVRDASSAAGCAEDDVALAMARHIDRAARLEAELKATQDQVADLEIAVLLGALPGASRLAGTVGVAGSAGTVGAAGAVGSAGITGFAGIEVVELGQGAGACTGFVLLLCADRDYTEAARLAKAGAAKGVNTIAASFGDCKIVAASAATTGTTNGGLDLGKLFKPLIQIHGGKGGGSGFFQAAFPGPRELNAFIEALRGNTP
jgi:alanyl-tRNA synthetase